MRSAPGTKPSRPRRVLAAAAIVAIAGLAAAALYQGLHDISYRALSESLRSIPQAALAAALIATVASYGVLVANDFCALRYAGSAPPRITILLASFCGYGLGNVIGLGALSGGAVRLRVYGAAGVSVGKIARLTLFLAGAFGIGAAGTIATGLVLRGREIADLCHLPYAGLCGLAGVVGAAIVVFLGLCAVERRPLRLGSFAVELPDVGLAIVQLGITAIDLTIAAAALWTLLPATGIDFPSFVVIYVTALGLGVASHAPGGIGVFDAAVLCAVGTSAQPSAVAAALLAYRAIYLGLPFALATALLICTEINRSLRQA